MIYKKKISHTLGLVVFSFSSILVNVASAEEKGFVASVSKTPIDVYKLPGDAEPAAKIVVKDLPWRILDESKDGFFLVSLSGKRWWVDSMDVTANRTSSSRCSDGIARLDIAGQPGAANDICK